MGHWGQEESTRNCPGMYETQGKTGTLLQPSVPKWHIRRLKGLQVVNYLDVIESDQTNTENYW